MQSVGKQKISAFAPALLPLLLALGLYSLTMKIRVATTEDFPIIQSLFQELFLLLPNRQEEKWPRTKEGQEYLSKKIDTDHVLVAELNGSVVGYLIWSVHQGMSFQKFKNYAELQSMCVSEKHRNNGIGTKLCKAFLDVCEREGLDTIMVESSILPETVGFYEKLGFVEERKVMFLSRSCPNKANTLGRQKASLVPRSASKSPTFITLGLQKE